MLKFFCLGFPKTGTNSIGKALRKAGLRVAHSSTKHGRPCVLLTAAYREGRDPAIWLPYEALVHPSTCVPRKGLNHWPQMNASLLASLRRHHPDAVFCLNVRPIDHLTRSIVSWRDQQKRYTESDIPGLPVGIGKTEKELRTWIKWHWQRMRKIFENSDRFIEINIEDPDECRQKLSEALNVRIHKWPWLNRTKSSQTK